MGDGSRRVTPFVLGGRRYVLLSAEAPDPGSLKGLSVAEREVVAGVLRGRTTADIARDRGCAYRTVANQLASVYRKLGVSSRHELVARLVAPDE